VLFQSVDSKKFVGVYVDGVIHRDSLPEGIKTTWGYCSFLPDDVIYASLYCKGKPLDEVCPDNLLSRWKRISGGLKAHLSACQEAKVDLQDICFLDVIPERLLLDFCEIKNKITEHVLENYPRPENYDFLFNLERILADIRSRKVNLDLDVLKPHLISAHARAVYKRLQRTGRVINYDAHKTKTGRLTTKKDSFPILTLNKTFRQAIMPNNDHFVELDFNAAELRTLLSLLGKEQPAGDIHEWNIKNVYRGHVTREEAKKRIFAWLYNPESKDHLSNHAYSRDEILEKHWDGEYITTCFGRKIKADKHHAVNYTIQSTTSDLFLKRTIEVDKILRDRKSYIAFTLHDSLVIDFAKEDTNILREAVETFQDTDLGRFTVNVSVGDNFGEMKRLRL